MDQEHGGRPATGSSNSQGDTCRTYRIADLNRKWNLSAHNIARDDGVHLCESIDDAWSCPHIQHFRRLARDGDGGGQHCPRDSGGHGTVGGGGRKAA